MTEVRADDGTPVRWEDLAAFMRKMLVTLDGLWFMNALEEVGPERALAMDVKVMVGQFKLATRLWRKARGLDGRSVADKVSIFQAMAHLYGHRFQVLVEGDEVTMRLTECAFYENLKRAGRAGTHDCRQLCRRLGPAWFAEIEPRTGGEGRVDLQLPVGGTHCDWTVRQPPPEPTPT